MSQPIVIIGASTRAAAMSARRAGLTPYCCDLFGDTDLAQTAERFTVVDDYPNGLVSSVAEFPPAPWMYVGAIENSPKVISKISETRQLWGIGGSELDRIRNPLTMRDGLQAGGASVPVIQHSQECLPPRDGSWLVKPCRSAGGRCITVWDADAVVPSEPHFFQRFVGGEPLSAIFVGRRQEKARLCGVTRQLIGDSGCSASPFAYCGSIGPIAIDEILRRELAVISRSLAQFNLAGLIGVDFVFDGLTAWVIEVNPRYSASVEILEHGGSKSLLTAHAAAFDSRFSEQESLGTERISDAPDSVKGKAIVFATHDFDCPDFATLAVRNSIEIADIPKPGSRIKKNQPICTVFAAGKSESEIVDSLRALAAWVDTVPRDRRGGGLSQHRT